MRKDREVTAAAANEWRHQQAGLKVLLTEHASVAYSELDPNHLGATLDPFLAASIKVAQGYGAAWAELAARYYEECRGAAGVTGRFSVTLAGAIPDEQVRKSMMWATRNLWNNPADPTAAGDVTGSLDRLARNQGRDTISSNATTDRRAMGWAREAEADACSFCALLATRGAVYRSAETAGDGNDYHDHCECEVVPVFDGEEYQPPDYVSDWTDLYNDSTAGLSGAGARSAFRSALDGSRASPDDSGD